MITIQQQLLAEVLEYCQRQNCPLSRFGLLAVHDTKLVARLRENANLTLGTVERVRAFMRAHPNLLDEEATATSE